MFIFQIAGKAETLLEFAQNTAKLGGWEYNLKSDKITLTKEIYDIFEINRSKPADMNKIINLLQPDAQKRIMDIIDQVKLKQEPWDKEFKFIAKNGEIKWLRTIGKVIEKFGKVAAVSGTVQDITDRKNTELYLEESLKDKEILLQEVHHRVRNNLSIISSLLMLQLDQEKDERIRNAILKVQKRIMVMALLFDQLYQEETIGSINVNEYFHKMVNFILNSDENYSGIKINIDVIETMFTIETMFPLSLIVNEILSNSLTHAFKDISEPTIDISLQTVKDNSFELIINDNGIGFASDINILSDDIASTGFTLITSLTDQLQGKIELLPAEGNLFWLI